MAPRRPRRPRLLLASVFPAGLALAQSGREQPDPFDCLTGAGAEAWPLEKPAWCCSRYGVGCTSGIPYDCSAGRDRWAGAWSEAKKAWCCEHEEVGCQPPTQARRLGAARAPSAPSAAARGADGGGVPSQVTVLEPGFPRLVWDLDANVTRCFALRVPSTAKRVRVLASAVGLAGSPLIQGGWLPRAPGLEPGREAGFQTLAEELPRNGSHYYHVCLSTLSSQGCDAVLTAQAADASDEEVPPVWLRPNFPSIWRLGGGEAFPESMRFVVEADELEDIRVSAVPVSGLLDVEVHSGAAPLAPGGAQASDGGLHFGGGLCRGAPIRVLANVSSPEVVDVLHSQQKAAAGSGRRALCIRVAAAAGGGPAIASLTVGPRIPGPYLAAAVPTGGRLDARPQVGDGPACSTVRLLVNAGADTTVTAIAEDGSPLRLSAMLTSELMTAALENHWSGQTPLGGAGAVLLLRGKDVAAAAEQLGEQGEACLSIAVCRLPTRHPVGAPLPAGGVPADDVPVSEDPPPEPTRFWITAVTDRGVVTLEDGFPFGTTVPATDDRPEGSWRDFRFLVRGGAARPREVTISATTQAGKARLVADTSRHPRNARAYRWASIGPESSHAVIRLTTDPELESDEVRLVDCRLPCFVYLSATAGVDSPHADLDLEVQVESDAPGVVKELLEAQQQEETLAAGEVQVFRHRLPRHGPGAVLLSLSVSSGAADFQVSASPNFPDDPELTTRPAKDVVLLEPSSPCMRAAVEAAAPLGAAPVLYVRVRTGSRVPCAFAIGASRAGSVKSLYNGEDTRGAVVPGAYDRYRFFVGKAQADDKVMLDVIPLTGDPVVFMSCGPNEYPRLEAHDWSSETAASAQERSIVFRTRDAKFRPGWVYVGVMSRGKKAAYTLRARWGRGAEDLAVQLQDGMEEVGSIARGAVSRYTLSLASEQPEGRPIALRAEALTGAIGLCVIRHGTQVGRGGAAGTAPTASTGGRQKPVGHDRVSDCPGYYAVANASLAESGGSVAAADLPAAEAHRGLAGQDHSGLAVVELIVWGLGAGNNTFILRALASAGAATIGEEHRLLADVLGPPCCVEAVPNSRPRLLERRYLRFVRLGVGDGGSASAHLELRALGGQSLSGAVLRARWGGGGVVAGKPAAPGASDWPLEAASKSGATRLRLRAPLDRLLAHRGDREGAASGGFWLEVSVQVRAPLNYTLSLGDFLADLEPAAAGHLHPGQWVHGSITEAGAVKYDFEIPAGQAGWRLRLRQCYGRAQVALSYNGEQGPDVEGDVDVALHVPHASSRGHGVLPSSTAATAVIRSGTPDCAGRDWASATFEIQLVPPGSEPHLLLPESTALRAAARPGTPAFAFGASAGAVGLGGGEVGPGPSLVGAGLRYNLVVVPRNDSCLNANTTCGLREALRRGAAMSGGPVLEAPATRQRGAPVEALLPSLGAAFDKTGYWVNALVEMLSAEGQPIEAHSYTAYELNATAAANFAKASKKRTHLGLLAVLLMAAVACCAVSSKRNLCFQGEEDGPRAVSRGLALGAFPKGTALSEDDLELEVQYDLHQEPHGGLQQQRLAYVPPSV